MQTLTLTVDDLEQLALWLVWLSFLGGVTAVCAVDIGRAVVKVVGRYIERLPLTPADRARKRFARSAYGSQLRQEMRVATRRYCDAVIAAGKVQ